MEIDEPSSYDISMVVSESDDDMFASSQEDNTLIKHDSATSSSTETPQCSRTEISNSSVKNETSHTEIPWRGTPLHKLIKNTGKDLYPPVAVSPQHTVLFKLPVKEGQVPKPWPEKPQDNWDQNHVRMPHSASNLYPVTPTELRSRWELVQQALSSPISSSQQLEAAILHYNSKYSDRWDFRALHSFFSTKLNRVMKYIREPEIEVGDDLTASRSTLFAQVGTLPESLNGVILLLGLPNLVRVWAYLRKGFCPPVSTYVLYGISACLSTDHTNNIIIEKVFKVLQYTAIVLKFKEIPELPWKGKQGELATTRSGLTSVHCLAAERLSSSDSLEEDKSCALEEVETEYFFAKVLPKVVELALSLPTLLTQGVPLLKQHVTHSISLTQQQISCLLANAFLCTFPRRNTGKKDSEYSTYPSINFNRLFTGDYVEDKGRLPSLHEKLKCLINYFRRVTTKVPEGVVTYSRHYVPPGELPDWSKATNRLPNMYVSSTGTIEDEGTNMLQVDFANRFIGGGVLGRGCVQEEIRFVICPELLLARLFAEVLDDTEAIIISGCERFSTYQGYSNTFEWTGNVEDSTPRDSGGRRLCTVLAIDASRFPSAKTQYSEAHISRELNKV
ncbi:hypothetical protein J6590_034897 [Homalodisca vitripennis]|nr:hypothetical protein J6590_034897 [Homalodisca vitripennis]